MPGSFVHGAALPPAIQWTEGRGSLTCRGPFSTLLPSQWYTGEAVSTIPFQFLEVKQCRSSSTVPRGERVGCRTGMVGSTILLCNSISQELLVFQVAVRLWELYGAHQQTRKPRCRGHVKPYSRSSSGSSFCKSSEQAVRTPKRPHERHPHLKANVSPMFSQGTRQKKPQSPCFSSFRKPTSLERGPTACRGLCWIRADRFFAWTLLLKTAAKLKSEIFRGKGRMWMTFQLR